MRTLLILLMSGSAAIACDGRSDLLEIQDWRIEKVESGPIKGMDIHLDVVNLIDSPFRMIDATFTFSDVLGQHISSFEFIRDLKATKGEVMKTVNGYMGSEMDRVLTMNHSDVIVTTCVHAIVSQDGSKEIFSPNAD